MIPLRTGRAGGQEALPQCLVSACSLQGSEDKAGLVVLTSSHVVPEVVFTGTPLKRLRELDGA